MTKKRNADVNTRKAKKKKQFKKINQIRKSDIFFVFFLLLWFRFDHKQNITRETRENGHNQQTQINQSIKLTSTEPTNSKTIAEA
jgi:hypothetical protein